MLTEIHNLKPKLRHGQCLRIVTCRKGMDIVINKDDILKTTKSGMLRIIRPNERVVIINPDYIIMVCPMREGALP